MRRAPLAAVQPEPGLGIRDLHVPDVLEEPRKGGLKVFPGAGRHRSRTIGSAAEGSLHRAPRVRSYRIAKLGLRYGGGVVGGDERERGAEGHLRRWPPVEKCSCSFCVSL